MCLVTTAAPNLRPTRPGLKALGGGVLRSHPLAGLDEDWDEIEDCMAGTGSDASGSSAASTVAAIEDPAEESMSEADQAMSEGSSEAGSVQGEGQDAAVHAGRGIAICVRESPGFLCRVQAHVELPIDPVTAFKQLITHPDNAAIFRHLIASHGRRVLSDDGAGHRLIELEQEGRWKLLCFNGAVHTPLTMEEDDNELEMRFALRGPGSLLSRFVGAWRVEPLGGGSSGCLVTLEQDLSLSFSLPRPFDGGLKRIACAQVRTICEDLRAEAEAIARGKPSLAPWREARES